MRKLLAFSVFFITIASCNGTTDNNAATGDTTNNTGLTNPSAIDTTQHPNGITTGDVISTDTAAMNTQNSINKAKTAIKKK